MTKNEDLVTIAIHRSQHEPLQAYCRIVGRQIAEIVDGLIRRYMADVCEKDPELAKTIRYVTKHTKPARRRKPRGTKT